MLNHEKYSAGPKMRKTDKRIKRDTVLNYYVPPPARNKILEEAESSILPTSRDGKKEESDSSALLQARQRKISGPEYYVPPPARNKTAERALPKAGRNKRSDRIDCYIPPPLRKLSTLDTSALSANKVKDRPHELKFRKMSDENKICNNSSLLFREEDNEPSPPNQDNNEPTTKKKKKKKKKKNKSGDGSLLEGSSSIPDVSVLNCPDDSCEEIVDIPSSSDSLARSNDSSNNAQLNSEETHSMVKNDVQMLQNFEQCKLQDELNQKRNDSNLVSKKQSLRTLPDNDGSDNQHAKVKMKNELSCVENSNETDIPVASSSDYRCLDQDDQDEWENLLNDVGFGEFDIQNSTAKNLTGSNKVNRDLDLEKESNDSSIIEIYGFPEEFKTQDLLIPFYSFVERGFKIKWVDNTHALGIFPTSLMAEEALNSPSPFVKTRPLSQASQASKDKAQSVTLPPALRPKTCTALARRLVSGALGVRAVFTKEEREAEKEILKEAREQKRLAAKQREAAWEGKF